MFCNSIVRKRRWEEANGGGENVPFNSSIEQPPEEKGRFQFVSEEAVEKVACGVVPKILVSLKPPRFECIHCPLVVSLSVFSCGQAVPFQHSC